MKRKTHRVQLELPEKSMERLNNLRDMTESSSYAEVIRNSIRLYEAMVREAADNKEFLIKDADGKTFPYKVFLGP